MTLWVLLYQYGIVKVTCNIRNDINTNLKKNIGWK